ncbi:MAG TPA: hypothetical protein VGL83_10805 [Stellaceae bacterium]|jgi:hypothetical protein
MGDQRRSGFSHISRLWLEPGDEPALGDLLADPVLHLVMRRDGVSMTELCNHISQARLRLGLDRFRAGPCRCAA